MDDADRTEERTAEYEAQIVAAFSVASKHRDLLPTGMCHYCDEPVTDDRLFCHPDVNDCAKDWAYAMERNKVNGKC